MRRFVAFASIILVCSTCALASGLSGLPPEAQTTIKAALRKDIPVQNFTLTASDGQDNDQFGASVAIDGNTVVVGAYNANQLDGAVYVFVKPHSGWANMTQTAKLTPSDGVLFGCFGCSVSISGNTVVVGASGATVGVNKAQGAAYVFVEPPTGWTNMTETAKLTASDGLSGAQFGSSVGINRKTVLAGAPGTNPMQGEAYIFVEPSGGWADMTQTAKLIPSDGFDYDNFGLSASISGNTALVGAPDICSCSSQVGRGYVFVEPVGGWSDMTQTAELTASDGQIGNFFSLSVSISGNTAVLGSPLYPNYGAVYVFVKPRNGWTSMNETAELLDGATAGEFGWSTSISGSVVIGGATAVSGFRGISFVFVKPSGGWANTSHPTVRLSIPFTYGQDYFGNSVAVSGSTAIVGAPDAPSGPPPQFQPGPGEAFVFTAQ